MILVAGHDEPVQRLPVSPAGHQDLPGEHLKEGAAGHRGDREGPLGSVETLLCEMIFALACSFSNSFSLSKKRKMG